MNKNIKCIPFPNIPNAYVVISGRQSDIGNGVEKCMSFFYDNGELGAEWEPDYGPITIIRSVDKEHKEARPHWFYDYYTGNDEWYQLAVANEGLADAFIDGNYEYLFNVLRKYSE